MHLLAGHLHVRPYRDRWGRGRSRAVPHPCSGPGGLTPHLLGGQQTHHSFREPAEFHVVGSENGLPVALDEGRVLSDQPQPVLQTRTGMYSPAPGAQPGEGAGEESRTHCVDDDGDVPGLGCF